MITTTDVANILYSDCISLRMPVFQSGNAPSGYVGEDGRIVIHAKAFSSEKIWKKAFVEVNLFASDTPGGNADLIKLNHLERTAISHLENSGTFDGTPYSYTVTSTSMLTNEELKAHYVNAKVLFKALNTME